MKINICISVQSPRKTQPQYVRTTIDEDDLLEWAKDYVADKYTMLVDGITATDVEIESIIT